MKNYFPSVIASFWQFGLLAVILSAFCSIPVSAQPEFSRNDSEFNKVRRYNIRPYDDFSLRENFNNSTHVSSDRFPSLNDGMLDSGFNSSVTEGAGSIYDMVIQPDGKIIVAGSFQRINADSTNITRLNSDGSIDATFNTGTGTSGIVRALALQPDGKIVIAGAFTSFNNQTVNRIVRINQDGNIDTSFNSAIAFNNTINDVIIQPDGKILVGGQFTNFSSRLFRLNTDGSVDTVFSGTGAIRSVVYLPNGKILTSGDIGSGGRRINRFNSNGIIDTTFNTGGAGPSGVIYKIVVQPNGKIIAGGQFSSYNGVSTNSLIRLNEDGSLDANFNLPNTSNQPEVGALSIQSDGKILAAYDYGDVVGYTSRILRFNADATLDTSFAQGNIDQYFAFSIELFSDGRILVGGDFTVYNNQPQYRVVKLTSNGTIDDSFNSKISTVSIVWAIKRQTDGKIIIGGDFEIVNGQRRSGIARLNADGTLDPSFNPGGGVYGSIYSLLIQSDGKILAGGFFSGYDNSQAYTLIRINTDGSFDPTFQMKNDVFVPVFVYSLATQSDGKIIVGGSIINLINGPNVSAIRLTANGDLDTSFTSLALGAIPLVRTILVQPDNKIIIGGNFINSVELPRDGLARLNANGSFDSSFTLSIPNVYALVAQADGKFYLGSSILQRYNQDGSLDASFNGGALDNGDIRALEIQPDGKILAGGTFSGYKNTAAKYLIRVNADGILDSDFHATPSGFILALSLQPDGKILVGGQFSKFNGTEKLSLVRLKGTADLADTAFDFDGDGKADISVFRPSNGVWYLQQSSAGFTGIAFGLETDKLVPADFDGDGKTDIAVYRNGIWYLQRSQAGFTGIAFGAADDIPVPADYDGDGNADLAVFRPSNGVWYIQQSMAGFIGVAFGTAGDKPVAADYDGDGKADIAVNRSGIWYIQRSQLGFTGITFGDANDKLVPADYDGDGTTDIAVFRPSNGVWYLQQSALGFAGIVFGSGTDVPVAADYDGDGKADIAVFRPSNGVWYLNRSSQGFTGLSFGVSSDRPIPNAFVR